MRCLISLICFLEFCCCVCPGTALQLALDAPTLHSLELGGPWQSCSWHPVCWHPGFPWTNPLTILSSQSYFFLLSPWRTSRGLEEQRNFLGEAGGGEEKVGELWKDARGCVEHFGKGRCCNIWGDRNSSLGGKRQRGGCGRCVMEEGGNSDMKVESEVRKLWGLLSTFCLGTMSTKFIASS